jgi:hypothetical protein
MGGLTLEIEPHQRCWPSKLIALASNLYLVPTFHATWLLLTPAHPSSVEHPDAVPNLCNLRDLYTGTLWVEHVVASEQKSHHC